MTNDDVAVVDGDLAEAGLAQRSSAVSNRSARWGGEPMSLDQTAAACNAWEKVRRAEP